jgi:hypothetical protein
MSRTFVDTERNKGYVKAGDLVYIKYGSYIGKGVYRVAFAKDTCVVECSKKTIALDGRVIKGWPGDGRLLSKEKKYWSVKYVSKIFNSILQNE